MAAHASGRPTDRGATALTGFGAIFGAAKSRFGRQEIPNLEHVTVKRYIRSGAPNPKFGAATVMAVFRAAKRRNHLPNFSEYHL